MSVEILKEWASSGKLGDVDYSDNVNIKLGDVSLPATETVTVTLGDKSCQYTLGSIYLQIQNPAQSLVEYRKACKSHNVKDPVKASDKATVTEYFGAAEVSAPQAETLAEVPKAAEEAPSKEAVIDASLAEKKSHHEKKREKQRDRDRRSDKKRSRSAHSKEPREKKAHKAIDPEKLFSNLSVVVGKREIKEKRDAEQAKLHAALSTEGFQVTPEEIAKAKEKFANSMVHEIPVGDSASILKAGAGKDLKRVLTLYNETMTPKKSSKKTPATAPSSKRAYLIGKRPIIILPKGMTAPITMVNAYDFFANSVFVPRDKKQKELRTTKQALKTVFTRSVNARLGGGKVEYELMDNPKSKLHSSKDWERIVAVVALGQSWQMKDWPGPYGNPVELFGRSYGFYIGMEGDKIPTELQGWSVKQARLNRDKRGLDSVTYASFWNGLDEWMTIHRPEMLPQQND
jgi:parafibromin